MKPPRRHPTDGGRDDGLERHAGPAGETLLVRADVARAGGAPLLAALFDPRGHGASVLKENPRRSVFLLATAIGPVVVKRYRPGGLADRLKERLGHARPRVEWRVATALRAAGLPAPEPLAVGPSLFAMRAVPGAVPLGTWLETHGRTGAGGAAWRGPWLERAADLLAALHRAGFDHRDFHGGNLLAVPGGVEPALWIVDLHRVTRAARVTTGRRVAALADLGHTLRFGIEPADAEALVRRYLAAAGEPDARAARWLAAVARATEHREARRVRSRTRRCVREGSTFTRVARGGVRGWRRRDVPEDALFGAVAAARAAMRAGDPTVRSLARRASVALADCAGRATAVKLYERDGFRSARGLVTRGRAGAAYVAAHGLAVRGVPVPGVLAWFQTPDRAVLVMDAVAGGVPLSVLSFRLVEGADLAARVDDVAAGVGGLIADLFRAGCRPGDLSPKNVLVALEGDAARAWLCDFDDVTCGRAARPEDVRRGLAQLNDLAPGVTLRPRLAVLRAVRRVVPGLRGTGVARAIARRTAARAARTLAEPAALAERGTTA